MLVEVLVTAEIKFPFRSYVNVFAAALFVTTTWYCCGGISNPAHNISMAHSRSNDGIVAWAVSRLGTAVAVEEEHWLLSGRERSWLTLRTGEVLSVGGLDTATIARLLSLSPRGTSGERDGEHCH